jgi:methylenetetrahydrofolate reductase (NADPH)
MKIIDKILERRSRKRLIRSNGSNRSLSTGEATEQVEDVSPQEYYYSFEFFPPKTEAGLDNLITRIDRMTQRLDPLFINVTWGAAGSTAARTLAVASHAQRYLGVDVLLHVAAQGTTHAQLRQILGQAKASGIHNLLLLRGDPPRGKRAWDPGDVSGGDCERAVDLVRWVKAQHGDFFGIAVAGHPEGHPSSASPDEELLHLREKLEAGADFIVTQFFYNVNLFLDYVRRCRAAGITCPILPGIMPIQNYQTLLRMTRYCQISVPPSVLERLEPIQNDDDAVKEAGIAIAGEMCRRILKEAPGVDGIHFYTLNLERSVTKILLDMGALVATPVGSWAGAGDDSAMEGSVVPRASRTLPWRPSTMEGRSETEHVRPINWANRPKSYVMRTEQWDEFPNGRWGDATSPAFGELSDLSHFYSFSLGSLDDRRAMLGENPKTPEEIFEVFASYVEGKVPHIPWCEASLQPESFSIQGELGVLNRKGFLTVNSQPAVNGLSSSAQTYGWGGPGGYVYQKAYCECFCSPEHLQALVEMTKTRESLHLYAINIHGEEVQEGVEIGGVTALTWGVFPNKEILQPTVFDPSTFLVWAEEAFSLWTTMWLNLYEFDTESFELIESIRDTYYLCAVIENDYIGGTANQLAPTLWQSMMTAANGLEEGTNHKT